MELGGYRLGQKLGEGATGQVHEARAANGETVALKVLHPDVVDAVLLARFRREARLANEITSPHVVPILDMHPTYLVMPLYPGGSLAARIRNGPLSADETIELAAQLARGLDGLHARGIVHRDVKPSNVLFDGEGRAALSDFGLARLVDSTRLTREGQILGTPHYLAPELIEGAEATPASDVYAFGCLLYECVADEPPFAARRLTELGFAHLTEPPPDPRDRRPDLPEGFAQALLAALEKDPAARPTTATALARMLSASRTSAPG